MVKTLLFACSMLWQHFEKQVRAIDSPQQTLLQERWVLRFSECVDEVFDKMSEPAFRVLLQGPNDGQLGAIDARELFVDHGA